MDFEVCNHGLLNLLVVLVGGIFLVGLWLVLIVASCAVLGLCGFLRVTAVRLSLAKPWPWRVGVCVCVSRGGIYSGQLHAEAVYSRAGLRLHSILRRKVPACPQNNAPQFQERVPPTKT